VTSKASRSIRWGLLVIAVLAMLAALAWANDFITLQGERTVYTADCEGGEWQGRHCTGQLRPGERVRFRALRAHGEVLFWTVGSRRPSSKLIGCSIENGHNWRCPGGPEAHETITLQMAVGEPVLNTAWPTRPFHRVTKWRWHLLHWGLPAGQDAEN
jgi:hypothetical protein